MNDWMPDWLRDLLKPVESGKGKGSINIYAGKRLEDLDDDPQARMEALSDAERQFDTPPPKRREPTDWKKLEEEAENQRRKRPAR